MSLPAPRPQPARPLVLIVDDHQDTLAWYSLALSATGFDVMAATSGGEAYVRASEMCPNVIAADLPMSNGDGWELLDRLKEDPRTRDVPVVVISDHVEQRVPERSNHQGVVAVISKPCPPHVLAMQLRRVLDAEQ